MTEPSPVAPDETSHFLLGRATVHRTGRWPSARYDLIQDGTVLAELGRTGWLRIYLGRGQWIRVADGDEWRIRAIGDHGSIIPVIFDEKRRKVAIAGSNHGAYGVTGKDFACSLYPSEKPRVGRANEWKLRQFGNELATITRHPLSVDARLPVHLAAVLLSFTLVRHGLPDDSVPRVPTFRWT